MKKIFTLLFCALTAFAANAQVEFIHNGEAVEEGATIEFHAEVLDFGDGFCIVECSPDAPFVRNAGTSEAKVTVTVTKSNAASDRLTWCGITSSCMPINGESETRSCTLGAGEQTALALHGGGSKAGSGEKVALTAENDGVAEKPVGGGGRDPGGERIVAWDGYRLCHGAPPLPFLLIL